MFQISQGPMKATRKFSGVSVAQGRSKKHSVDMGDLDLSPEQTLDIELAKSLKVFFRDMKDVQTKVNNVKELGKFPVIYLLSQ